MTDPLHQANSINWSQYQRLYVGFSGGLDSTVLLHWLASNADIHHRLIAVHVHHGLSTHADAWVTHCQRVCDRLRVPLIVRTVDFDRSANIEEGARIARMKVFSALLALHDGLLFAHHADDQAETMLLQLMRGTGIDGLAAMPVLKNLAQGVLIRPFLSCSKETLHAYALMHGLEWIHDESNQNEHFSRNYVRHQIMPLLKKKWPASVQNMARTATHCQQAIENLDTLAQLDIQTSPALSLLPLRTQSEARVTNVLRYWLKKNQVRMPSTDIIKRIVYEAIFSDKDASIIWGSYSVRSHQAMLYIVKAQVEYRDVEWSCFPADLWLHDMQLCAQPASSGLYVEAHQTISVRFRRGSETFRFRGQTKSLKKLLQEWHVPPWMRATIPLIYIDDCLAAVTGYAISDDYFRADGVVYSIRYDR